VDEVDPRIRDRPTKFPLGLVAVTPGAIESIATADRFQALARHSRGDWGDVNPAANEFSLIEGLRLKSVYRSGEGTEFWIITEADRSVTTILLPEED
jgi:hypothetical protein